MKSKMMTIKKAYNYLNDNEYLSLLYDAREQNKEMTSSKEEETKEKQEDEDGFTLVKKKNNKLV